jgi:hypothetical protein
MTATNHTSPIGEDAANVAISWTPAQLDALLEDVDRLGKYKGTAAATLFDCARVIREFRAAAAAANGAIGEREAFEAWAKGRYLTRYIGTYMERTADACERTRLAEAALSGWMARAALTAEKVAAEPTSIPFSAYRLKVAEECCERLMSACTDSGCPDGVNMADWIRQLAAPQQPAQSAEQGERSTGICFFCGEPIDGQHESDCPQSTAPQPAQTQVALTDEQREAIATGIKAMTTCGWTHRIPVLAALLAAQPVSGGKS